MITEFFVGSPLSCVVALIVVFAGHLIYKKVKHDAWWREYNDGLDRYANDPAGRDGFVERMTGRTREQEDELLRLEEDRNDLVYKALNK